MTQELHGVISLGGTVIGGSLYQRGLKGETGNGIESVVMTEAYNLVITYTDGDVVTLDTGLDDYEELLKGYKDDAESAKSDAESAKTDAVDAKNDAVSAKNDAVSAKNDAVSAKNDAVSAKSDAVSAKNDAVSAKTDAQSAKTAAETAQGKAESSASDSEAYAVGTRGGTPVSSGDVAYENNSKYMKEQAAIYTLQADSFAGESELWATGELDGTPVGNTYPQYENNSKYYAGEASSSATSAGGSASSAETDALKSEGFAVGEQNGAPVTSGSPYYHNNAKYFSEQFIRAFPTDTASGAIASFEDGSDLFDYLSCVVNIEPVQSGSGTPSPDNVRPITGWTGCNVVVSPTEDAQDGTTYPVSWQTEAGTVYGGNLDLVTGVLTVTHEYFSLNGTETWSNYPNVAGVVYSKNAFPHEPKYIVSEQAGISNMLKCITNVLFNTTKGAFSTSAANQKKNMYVRLPDGIADASAWSVALSSTPLQTCYELATPTTYQLGPVQVACLLGRNNVWADCGDVAVKYKADVQKWVEKQLREINTAILALS